MRKKARPTMYRGLQFRSRLEATWAAFFDEMKWSWEYEPCDFDGWIPDFLLGSHTYVEVKPWRTRAEIVYEDAWMECGCEVGESSMIVCGVSPLAVDDPPVGVQLGWGFGVYTDDGGGGDIAGEPVCVGPHGLRFGKYPKHDSLDSSLIYPFANNLWMIRSWHAAKNRTQWKGRNATS